MALASWAPRVVQRANVAFLSGILGSVVALALLIDALYESGGGTVLSTASWLYQVYSNHYAWPVVVVLSLLGLSTVLSVTLACSQGISALRLLPQEMRARPLRRRAIAGIGLSFTTLLPWLYLISLIYFLCASSHVLRMLA